MFTIFLYIVDEPEVDEKDLDVDSEVLDDDTSLGSCEFTYKIVMGHYLMHFINNA